LSASELHSDQQLLFKLNQNDEESFVSIYNRYWSKLYAIAFNRLNSKQSAEDVVQEVMITLWQRRNEVNIRNLEAWLSTATRYSVFRQLARYGSQKIVSINAVPEASYDQGFDSGFLDKMLKEQIHRLPERCKLVFQYSRNHGLSNKEISGELGISEKTVEKHITRALQKIREKLSQVIQIMLILIFQYFLTTG
jgi:RNA polymerase sigma-70 factor (ECF subfamily)